MATMNIKVQYIDSVLPDMETHGVVKISCDMNLHSMELTLAEMREQISEEDWKTIVENTDN